MKKIISSLFAVILVASLAIVALPGALQTSAQEAVEGLSTYIFSYETPETFVVGNDVNVDVTFSTDMLGTEGYEGVRFFFEADGPGDVGFTATDSEANVFTFSNSGYWGPAAGFSLPAMYTATTTWTLNFSAAGEYTIEFSLIYADDDEVITTDSVTISVQTESTYAFSYTVPENILPGNDVNVDVTFSTDMLGTEGYEGVRFFFEADGPGDVSFTATDSEANVFTFSNSGYWGPAAGFSLPAMYTATTTWTLNFSASGFYTISFSLIDAISSEVTANNTDTAEVTVLIEGPSTYEFGYTVPENIVVNTDIDVNVTLATDMPGTVGYENAGFSFSAIGPGDVTFSATDSLGDVYTFTNTGTWGPPEGFALPAIYTATTTWTLNFSAAGEYTIEFSLDDIAASTAIATGSVTVTVQALDANIIIEPETLNVGANGRWITAYIEVPEGYVAENIDVGSVQLLYGEQALTADWGDLQDGIMMVKFDRSTVASWMEGLHDVIVEFAVSGEVSGFAFEGVGSIRVIAPPVREQTNAGTPNRPEDIPGKGLDKEVGPAHTQNNQGSPGKPEGAGGKGNSENAIPEHANGRK